MSKILFQKKHIAATDMTSCRTIFHDIIEYQRMTSRPGACMTSPPGRHRCRDGRGYSRVMMSSPVPGATGALRVPEQLFSKKPAHSFEETIPPLHACVPPHCSIAQAGYPFDSRHRHSPRNQGPPSPKCQHFC